MSDYGYSVEVPEGYDEAVSRARHAFRGEGFSILSEMHVGGLLGPEAGDARQYLIMGVWNSIVGRRQVDGSDMEAAVHLPCNLVVQEVEAGAVVAALDPEDSIEAPDEVTSDAVLLAKEALGRVLEKVTEAPG
jgi:uncharacterized protein (DUF302 family)